MHSNVQNLNKYLKLITASNLIRKSNSNSPALSPQDGNVVNDLGIGILRFGGEWAVESCHTHGRMSDGEATG